MTDEARIREGLGEAIHTAFRKGTDCKQAHPIWKLIQEMDQRDWKAVVGFVWACLEPSFRDLLTEAEERGDKRMLDYCCQLFDQMARNHPQLQYVSRDVRKCAEAMMERGWNP